MKDLALHFREQVSQNDVALVRDIVESTGFFFDHEVAVAVELVEERLRRGEASGYYFLFADTNERTLGYSCYGPIACTVGSFDLYWIAVHRECQRSGVGRRLLRRAEEMITLAQGQRIYLETSSRPQYDPTRKFYLNNGYHIEAVLKDFYASQDDKVILLKRLE